MINTILKTCRKMALLNAVDKFSTKSMSIPSYLEKKALVAQKYDYLLILDFEATCDNDRKMEPQEIIEFPCLKLNTRTLNVDSTFHKFVKPDVHSTLTPFCSELTGILQAMVDKQPNLKEILDQFDKWLVEEKLKTLDDQFLCKFAFVTCGEWDLQKLLHTQCEFLGVEMPLYFRYWINLKKPFFKHVKTFPKSMMHMLELLNLEHHGKHHSGIDDVTNLANIVKTLLKCGVLFDLTSKV